MKKALTTFCTLLALILPFSKAFASTQNNLDYAEGSKITIEKYDQQTITNLSILCKTWGYLKYYHPEVAKGKYNWDFELFKIMPQVLEAKNKDQNNAVLYAWAKNIGEYETDDSPEKSMNVKTMREPNRYWMTAIAKDYIGDDLSKLLISLEKAKRDGKNKYIVDAPDYSRPRLFAGDTEYEDLTYPDVGYRLLSLFQYWNVIHYYYPYSKNINEDWDKLLISYIPLIIDVKDELAYKQVLQSLATKIRDGHGVFRDKLLETKKGYNMPPIDFEFIEDKPVVIAVHNPESKIRVGDIIMSVNGENMDNLVQEMLAYTEGSNYTGQLMHITNSALRTKDSIMTIVCAQDGKNISENMICTKTDQMRIMSKMMHNHPPHVLKDGIDYIYPASIQGGVVDKSMIKGKDMIIDLRGYPSPMVEGCWQLDSLLYNETKPFALFATHDDRFPGNFIVNEPEMAGTDNPNYYKGKVVILVNQKSISQSEFMTMFFQASPNAIVVGSTTAGADGNIAMIGLPGGIKTMFTSIGVYYPDGGDTQGIGILPDVEVKPTIKGIKEGRDEVLEKAIEIINAD